MFVTKKKYQELEAQVKYLIDRLNRISRDSHKAIGLIRDYKKAGGTENPYYSADYEGILTDSDFNSVDRFYENCIRPLLDKGKK